MALEIEPQGNRSNSALARAYSFAKRYDKAVEHQEIVIALYPHGNNSYLQQATRILGKYRSHLWPLRAQAKEAYKQE